MANVRKVRKTRRDGSEHVSWRATWTAADGKRRSKNFPKKGDADAHLKSQGGAGGSPTMTVADLGEAHYRHFDALVKAGGRAQASLDGYGTALDVHVRGDAAFARTKLCDLTTPKTQAFLDGLFERAGSVEVARRVRKTLSTWCDFGQRRGWLVGNPAKACKVESTERPDEGEDRCEIPPKDQLAALLRAAGEGPHPVRDTAVVRLLMFGGFRISELLGLADAQAIVRRGGLLVRVRERLERRYVTVGPVKSRRARRDVPLGPSTAVAVRAWRLARGPSGDFQHGRTKIGGRLFNDPAGGPLWPYQDFMRDCWRPMMERAGLGERRPDAKGVLRAATDFGPHVLRHVAASLWIAQDLKPKKVQELLGHSSLALTMDLYGHLWPDDDHDDALAHASEQLIHQEIRTAK